MKQINVGIIGTGWCGGIRANTCAANPLVKDLHICEIRPDRLAEVQELTNAASATLDYHEMLKNDDIDAFFISATPEDIHFPMAKHCLETGKHVFMEKPLSLTLGEADTLVDLAEANGVKFTVGYSQRFNHKFAYLKKCLNDGTIGAPVAGLVSRYITRGLGTKIGQRIKLSPAAMEATHDLDFLLWCLEPAKPVRVYSQSAYGAMKDVTGLEDAQWTMVTLDNGVVITVGACWSAPPGHPNFSGTWVEFSGTKGMLTIDDTHRDVVLNTMENGIRLPMSSMPGEQVEHVFAGPMHNEGVHFLEAVAMDKPVMVTPQQARQVMEVYMAADLSVERNEPVTLPLNSTDMSSIRIAS
ncbi:MAG: Gfo/Idh/MocA family oxidoreductase [Rhodospirillaceae bacterium]|jgi:predicted dehydrogenase|nr:Gfo/Idh/MocA family oxidoreductase [Rhodospirillaceae bacterium]MBT4589063.1 Gfo/Idh/MocA family oxidoreductase [Rhodospirillaceae bacterium]MBT4937921.1 Gfo/Idh/MocA family oxidoreductase [Rhodospirillaceae bacterium]MBT5940918.1 Gfo/Idh/MocA family oxidoreductase [Rhodospirillaceae bacterium]MBT7265708.1 Gfo/Idh/MocA family oxidoreductase [Rhodospirillaceae bacterium]